MYDYDRRSSPYSRSAARVPPPKFEDGDEVQVMDGSSVELEGVIYSDMGFDEHLGDRRYKVKPSKGGSAKTFNEKSLRAAPTMRPLSPRDLKPGLRIQEIAHPEHGVWKIVEKAKGTTGVWEISKPGGDKTLDEDELEHWRRAPG